ncbi:MAG: hypothetical protein A2Y77_11070 [Planctomycetes bacterium RBG_13_62_9]|nr:MAG: hypothetical protein A2Y77_11070 [Planctomycetes bacterium RBG_13_62_9]
MGNAAHAESLDHTVYHTPFAVEPSFESWNTPGNYRWGYLGADKLPDQMRVWLVQKTDQEVGGVVARGAGFTDSPDAEVLAPGFNLGKSYGDVGIGRHGNFLQWGYSAPPSQMTEPGRRLFLNGIHYIKKFDGKAPLVRVQSSARTDALGLTRLVNRLSLDDRVISRLPQSLRDKYHSDPRALFFVMTFSESLYDRYHEDPNGLTQYYRENLEWVYRDQVFKVDEELKGLGIDSNRKVESLRRLIELLRDAQHAATAKKLLKRYTDQPFEAPQHWRQWFEENKDRIFFSDVGGYKFFVAPAGYVVDK